MIKKFLFVTLILGSFFCNYKAYSWEAPPIVFIFKLKVTMENGSSFICFTTGPEDVANASGDVILKRLKAWDIPLYQRIYRMNCMCLNIVYSAQKEIAPIEFYATDEKERSEIDANKISEIINMGVLEKIQAWGGIGLGFTNEIMSCLKRNPVLKLKAKFPLIKQGTNHGGFESPEDADWNEEILIYNSKISTEEAQKIYNLYLQDVFVKYFNQEGNFINDKYKNFNDFLKFKDRELFSKYKIVAIHLMNGMPITSFSNY
jgi:hypothetical protein